MAKEKGQTMIENVTTENTIIIFFHFPDNILSFSPFFFYQSKSIIIGLKAFKNINEVQE